jgi:hypothetical protein
VVANSSKDCFAGLSIGRAKEGEVFLSVGHGRFAG